MTKHEWDRLLFAAKLLDTEEYGSALYDVALFSTWHTLNPTHREVLEQLLFRGPVWDGDILSKSHRDDLFKLGLAVRCCFKGEQGYTAASYRAYTLRKANQVAP